MEDKTATRAVMSRNRVRRTSVEALSPGLTANPLIGANHKRSKEARGGQSS
jgi:hypothetical protein